MEEDEEQTLIFLGRDLTKVPCFRQSVMYSVPTYFGVSLLTFLFTSKPSFSSHVGIGVSMALYFGYFNVCRYKYEKNKMQIDQMHQKLQEREIVIKSRSYARDKNPQLIEP